MLDSQADCDTGYRILNRTVVFVEQHNLLLLHLHHDIKQVNNKTVLLNCNIVIFAGRALRPGSIVFSIIMLLEVCRVLDSR